MQGKIVVSILTLCFMSGCWPSQKSSRPSANAVASVQNSIATGFSTKDFADCRMLTVKDPWQKSTDNQFDYYLLKKGEKVPISLKGKPIFFTPVKRVICLSTTHIGFLDALDEVASIVGLSGCNYLTNPEVKKGVAEGRIQEVGYEQGLNYELILQLKPDVVFAYGVGSEINVQLNKLHDLGIPVVLVGEYLEKSPLSKAEWISFFGAFFGKEKEAKVYFDSISTNYDRVREKAGNMAIKPRVLTGLPFKDTWWMAGGQSNLAVLIEDAGASFLWGDNSSEEAFPVSLEEVFMRAVEADFWINCGSVGSMEELMAYDRRFSELPVVKNRNIFNNNLRSMPGGGNDYWESGVVHPDLILEDLVRIFHPGAEAGREFYYYRKIQ